MNIDITTLSEAELITLRANIEKELVRKAAQKKSDAKKAIENIAKEYGFTVQELLSGKAGSVKGPSVAKYAHPENPSQTWTGKGRQPTWFKEALDSGMTAESLEV